MRNESIYARDIGPITNGLRGVISRAEVILKSRSLMDESNKPFISIGITTYNRKELLKRCLASILNQTNGDFEVLIGNDYQKEELSADVLGIHDTRVNYINHKNNIGERQNLNYLLQCASGRYFSWQFDDDYYGQEYVNRIYGLTSQYPNLNCVFTSFKKVFDDKFEMPKFSKKSEGELLDGKTFLQRYWRHDIRAMGFTGTYRTSYLRSIGGAPALTSSPYALYSEYLLLFQTAKESFVGYIDEPLVFYYVHEGSWGNANSELERYEEAGVNLFEKSLEVFRSASLIEDIRRNTRNLSKMVFHDYAKKSSMQPGLKCLRDMKRFFNRNLAAYLSDGMTTFLNRLKLSLLRWAWSVTPITKTKLKKVANQDILINLLKIYERF